VNKNAVNSTNVNNGNNGAFESGWAQGAESARERRARKEALGSTSVSIAVVDPRSSQIVFAYSAGKAGSNQFEKTAEACAKSLKEFIEKSEKQKK
jgi:predicted RNA-binding protein with PIN domain